jgi:hypothetical protein
MPLTQQEIIKYLNDTHQKHHPQIHEAETCRELLAFTKKIYMGLAKGALLPTGIAEITTATSALLSRYSYNLMLYRGCLADLFANTKKVHKDYLDYVNEDNIYSRTLASGNPFLLRSHFSRLQEMVYHSKDYPLLPIDFAKLNGALQRFQDMHIASLSPAHYARFKTMLSSYGDVLSAQFMEYNLPDDKKNPKLTIGLYCKAKETLLTLNEDEIEQEDKTSGQDASILLYDDPHLFPSPSYENLEQTIQKINDLISPEFSASRAPQ